MKIVFRKGTEDSKTGRPRASRGWRLPKLNLRSLHTRKSILYGAGSTALLLTVTLVFFYFRFESMIDARLAGHLYPNPSQIFGAPKFVAVGQAFSSAELVNYLQRVGYTDADIPGTIGLYRISKPAVEVRPSGMSYFEGKNSLRIEFAGRRISRIRNLITGSGAAVGEIEPELITNLFDQTREKRRPVRFEDLPKPLVSAILAAEDKRFFDHPGFDPIRILGAAWMDLRKGEKAQGASTITMQVARSFFFTTRRVWSRKLAETFMAVLLEHRFTKNQIFELYANEVYLGNRGSFAIHGFGEAAKAYFGKDVRDLTLAQCAFLAGIIRSPNRYTSAERRPERASEARDRVLGSMMENRVVAVADAEAAKKDRLRLVSSMYGASLPAYFVDMVKDDLLDRYSENDLNSASYRIYTSLDTDLERYAGQAIEAGIKNLDAQLSRRYAAWLKQGEQVLPVQVGLVALDPHTGEIRALIGGRDYASSQLNHTLASRQPGSSFKPFVYAAAFDNAVEGLEPVLTPASTVVDEPTAFYFDGKEYSPKNDSDEYLGTVSLRDALVHSLNVATVKVAQEVGFRRVADLAKALGIGDVHATPSMALGAYETTPFEIAAAYTALANDGIRCEPSFLQRVVGPGGERLEQQVVRSQRVLDSRVSYLVTNVLEDVVARGTGAGVRARGFIAPAAGKTGTSRDGWFAGYTSNLLCVVWVGFDDNRELGLTGAASAVPIWTEFMKRAVTLPRYRSTQPFVRPEGIVFMSIDPQTQQAATPNCPVSREEVFIAGTEPTDACALHGGLRQESLPPFSWFSRFFMQPIEDQKDQAGPQPKRAAKQNDKRNSFMRPVHSDRR